MFDSWTNGFKSIGVYAQEASHSGIVIDNIKVKVTDKSEEHQQEESSEHE